MAHFKYSSNCPLDNSGANEAVAEQTLIAGTNRLPSPNATFSEYKRFTENTLYIDKTMILKDILDGYGDGCSLCFTRPRRFGKTLMMSTLKSFFEKPGTGIDVPAAMDTSLLFQKRKIWTCGEKYRREQGKYPVIYLTFAEVKAKTWNELYLLLCHRLREEVLRHKEILQSDKCSPWDIQFMNDFLNSKLSMVELKLTLRTLSRMLSMHYGELAVIIIDEYDTPFQEGCVHEGNYCDEVREYYGGLLSNCLKDNTYLKYGFITGILRAAKVGSISGLNNAAAFSVLDRKFSTYFGFTEEEVRQIAKLYGREDKVSEICKWYDGYLFGGTRIFNPWSVLNYFDKGCEVGAYWVDSSENIMVDQLVKRANAETLLKLNQLQNWEPGQEMVREELNLSIVYPKMGGSKVDFLSFLLMTGYLTAKNAGLNSGGRFCCDLFFPNRVVRGLFRTQVMGRFTQIDSSKRTDLQAELKASLKRGDPAKVQEILEDFLLETPSSFDITIENAYQLLLLGIFFGSWDQYYVTSNRESGYGRYDIQLEPISKTNPGILLELKSLKDEPKRMDLVLHNHARKAISQTASKRYDTELRKRGIHPIRIYGLAFYGKHVAVVMAGSARTPSGAGGKAAASGAP